MKNIKRRWRTLVAATVAVTSIVIVSPGTASGSTEALSDCPANYFCVWSGTAYTGGIRTYNATNTHITIDLASTQSYYNRRTKRVWLNQYAGGGGSSVCINPGVKNPNTAGWQESAKDAYITSIASC